MADFKKTVATAKAKVAKAESLAFAARLEAMDAILPRPVARRTRTSSRRSFCGCWATALPSGRSRKQPRTTASTRRCTEGWRHE